MDLVEQKKKRDAVYQMIHFIRRSIPEDAQEYKDATAQGYSIGMWKRIPSPHVDHRKKKY